MLPADSAEACFAPPGGPWLDPPSELVLWTFGPLPDKPSESDADAAELAAASSCGSMQPRYAAGIHTALAPSAFVAAAPADSTAPLVDESVIDGEGLEEDAMDAASGGIGDPLVRAVIRLITCGYCSIQVDTTIPTAQLVELGI